MAPSAVGREIRRVAAYIRVSRKAQNPEMQAEDIAKFCAARGWEIVTTERRGCRGRSAGR